MVWTDVVWTELGEHLAGCDDVEYREGWRRRECAAKMIAGDLPVAEAVRDHPGMEGEQWIASAQAKRLLAGSARGLVVAALVQRPGERIGRLDARALRELRASTLDGTGQIVLVIGVEQRELQVDVDTVRAVELLDRPDERVLALSICRSTCDRVQVAQGDDELRQRHDRDQRFVLLDRCLILAVRCGDASEARSGVHILRRADERPAI